MALALGDITITRVIESEEYWLTPEEVFPDYTPEAFAARRDLLVPRHYDPATNMMAITNQGYLVRTPRRTILVDSASGNDKDRGRPFLNRRQWPFLEALAAAGAAPGDVDLVVCTHLHVDHVGWNTVRSNGDWVPTFPAARYVFVGAEWEHWSRLAAETGLPRSGNYIADSVAPVVAAGLADLVAADAEIEPGIRLVPLPGHTPGQAGVLIEGGGRRALLCGDAIHHVVQIVHPEWSTNFDTDQDLARQTRRDLLEGYADSGTAIFTAHFPSPTGGYVESGPAGFGFRFLDG